MLILIDGVPTKTKGAYVINDKGQPVSFHRILIEHIPGKNQKIATGGHVYVLNYNPKTFVRKYPMTYNEFKENGYKF